MIYFTAAFAVFALIVLYLALPGGRLWKQYLNSVKTSLTALGTDASPNASNRFTRDRIAGLPALLQKHIICGGYLDQAMMENMLIRFPDAKFKMSPDKKPMGIQFMQVNFVRRPDRHAFLSGRIAGVPIQAIDRVLDGAGSMTGVLFKQLPLFCSTGAEMDQSQLITALADAAFMPSLFLQEYVSWRIIDESTVEGVITWKGVSAKGRFSFDRQGRIIRFCTNDRFMDENGKGSTQTPWYVTYSDYKAQNGFTQPGSVKVSWVLPGGDDTYFESTRIEIQYSIDQLKPTTF